MTLRGNSERNFIEAVNSPQSLLDEELSDLSKDKGGFRVLAGRGLTLVAPPDVRLRIQRVWDSDLTKVEWQRQPPSSHSNES